METISSWAFVIIAFVAVISGVALITKIENRAYNKIRGEKMSDDYLFELRNRDMRRRH